MNIPPTAFPISKSFFVLFLAACSLFPAGAGVAADEKLPDHLTELAWAYAINISAPPPLPEDSQKHSLPNTPLLFTRDEILGRKDGISFQGPPADWYPGDHPKMPAIYANGDPARKVIACALCHYPNGKGKAENAPPGGQDKTYLIQQLRDFKSDLRKCADPRKSNYALMSDTAKGMTEEEFEEVAEYMESLKWTKWINVVETDTVPKTYLRGGLHIPIEGEGAGTEPIGKRIIETPVDPYGTEFLRNPRSGFVAYVPVGAPLKGAALVYGGGEGKTLQCVICHGPDLMGIGNIPAIAARSPSYMARQLNDMKQGTRHGEMAALMQPVVANLTSEDILNIVAFLASLPAPEPEYAKP
ncbi:MAG: c-type cytochrome [Verrucomicrobiales bacterium]|nr:c-type cytochrome [Verrucomicrobiales bacterium]